MRRSDVVMIVIMPRVASVRQGVLGWKGLFREVSSVGGIVKFNVTTGLTCLNKPII